MNKKDIEYLIDSLEQSIKDATQYAGDLIGKTLYDYDKEIENEYYKDQLIIDERKLFDELYDKVKRYLNGIKDDFQRARKEPETEDEEINF